ncbi:MAG: hypothetical protein ACLSVD_00580 [Eggerthellaceae bacterium]
MEVAVTATNTKSPVFGKAVLQKVDAEDPVQAAWATSAGAAARRRFLRSCRATMRLSPRRRPDRGGPTWRWAATASGKPGPPKATC